LQYRNLNDAYKILMASVIETALNDLEGIGYGCRANHKYSAMDFILSDTCEAWCMELKIDYERIRKKAVEFHKRIVTENNQITVKKKRTRKPVNPLERVRIRKVIYKRRITSDR